MYVYMVGLNWTELNIIFLNQILYLGWIWTNLNFGWFTQFRILNTHASIANFVCDNSFGIVCSYKW